LKKEEDQKKENKLGVRIMFTGPKKPFFVEADNRLLPQQNKPLFFPQFGPQNSPVLKFPIEFRTKLKDGVELRSFTALLVFFPLVFAFLF
jgi:hypothetical protein